MIQLSYTELLFCLQGRLGSKPDIPRIRRICLSPRQKFVHMELAKISECRNLRQKHDRDIGEQNRQGHHGGQAHGQGRHTAWLAQDSKVKARAFEPNPTLWSSPVLSSGAERDLSKLRITWASAFQALNVQNAKTPFGSLSRLLTFYSVFSIK